VSYYGAGDYYGAGGLGSFFGRIGRGAIGFATGGPVGAVSGLLSPGGGGGLPRAGSIPLPGGRRMNPLAAPPGGGPFIEGMPRRKRRRVNYTNQKALRRANRRVDGFVKEVKKSLKHTNYTLVTKGSRSRSSKKAPAVIVETGPGGVRA